jgi:tyrocidine synthetase-3
VPELFDEQVLRSPEAIALVYKGTEISYAELQRRAELLAAHLHERGVGQGSCVGIFLDHSIETVVAILGVLRAGATYVPLDTDHPRTRLAFIFEDAQLETVLAQQSLLERLPLNDGVQVILMDSEDWQRMATEGHPYKASSVASADPAYVIYTSGSTGQPKGVKISNRALVNYLSWCKDVYVRDEDVSFALYSSLAFDLTVTSIFVPLLSGNRLVIYGRSDRFPVYSIVQENLVDVLKLTPSHLALIKDLDNRHSRVKRLIVGGESLSTDLATQVHESFGGQVEILNEYGPTEATVGCMIYRFDPARDQRRSVPIGRPAANVQIYVLDEHLSPTPENVTGELYIAGAGLADGYVNRAELTAEKFISNPFVPGTRMYRSGDRARWLASSELEYLGRGDEQVKYHGYRIELSEISSALNQQRGAAAQGPPRRRHISGLLRLATGNRERTAAGVSAGPLDQRDDSERVHSPDALATDAERQSRLSRLAGVARVAPAQGGVCLAANSRRRGCRRHLGWCARITKSLGGRQFLRARRTFTPGDTGDGARAKDDGCGVAVACVV